MKTIDKYLAQAIDCYPGNLEAAIEALDYSLSYNEKSTMALCLYGRLMSEQLFKFAEAKVFFEKAIAIDLHAIEVYPYYIRTLTANEDYAEAQKLAEFAATIKGIDKYELAMAKLALYEKQHLFDEAGSALKDAKLYHTCNWDFNDLESIEKRLKMKRELVSGKEKPKKKKEKSKTA